MSATANECPSPDLGALAGLKASLAKSSQLSECGCSLRRWDVSCYIMGAPGHVSPSLPYDIEDANLCAAWEAFLAEHSPTVAKSPKHALELLKGAEWRSGLWLNDGARARQQGDESLATYCYERCKYWLERANRIAKAISQ
ncbi:hypothetical protein L4Z64_001232 [Pseudomonas aeruginosa]|nr:hypothetical protein [Pseudomonas aeruginosa]HCH7782587.1 hypothetical protein [Pseudomonas aeruginosa]